MKTTRLENPMGMDDAARKEHLVTLVEDCIGNMSKRNADPMEHISSADDIHYITGHDGRTYIGAKIFHTMPHGITLLHDTYEEKVEAQWDSTVVGAHYDGEGTDMAAYDMAASDLFWAVRS